MSYRDPLEAERARVEQLEEELEDARINVEQLEKVRVATPTIEPAPETLKRPEKVKRDGGLGLFGAIIVSIGVPILLLYWGVEALLKLVHSRRWLAVTVYSIAVCAIAYFLMRR